MKIPFEDAATEILPKVYDDLVHPSALQAGQAVGGLLRFVALPFKFLGMTAEQIENRYQLFITETINCVPQDNRITPKASIAVPLLEHVKYAFEEEELLAVFTNLLASCIDTDYSKLIHPSFVEKIKQLSKFDLKVLDFIRKQWMFCCCELCVKISISETGGGVFPQLYLFTNMEDFDDDPQQIDKPIDLLISLGILEVERKEVYRAEEYANRLIAFRDLGYECNYESDLFSNYFESCCNNYLDDYEGTLYNHDSFFYGIEFSAELEKIILNRHKDEINIEIESISSTRRIIKLTSYGNHFTQAIFRKDN